MKSKKTIQREYRKVKAALKSGEGEARARNELYGVQQSLAWVLDDYAMAPVKCAIGLLRKV